MTQPPVPGRGQGAQPGRDSRLAAFAQGDFGDSPSPPSAALTMLLDELSGPDRRCAGATDDELVGLLTRWAALESWATAAKLGVVRELIRRRSRPGLRANVHGDLPDAWDEGLGYELAAELGMSIPAAERLAV